MKSGFGFQFFFLSGMWKPQWNNPRGTCSFSWASPQSLMYGCFPPMHPSVSWEWEHGLAASCSCCYWGWTRPEQGVLEKAALKDAGGTGDFAFHKPCTELEERQTCPWRAGFCFSGVSGAAFLKASFLTLAAKEVFTPGLWRQRGPDRPLLGVFVPHTVLRLIQKFTGQNEFFSLSTLVDLQWRVVWNLVWILLYLSQ